MEIDHIGYAVKNIERSIAKFEELGYQFGEIIIDEKRNINIVFGEMNNYRLELISPIKEFEGNTPVDKYLKKMGNTPYHICYSSEHFQEDVKNLEKKNYKIILPPDNACAFKGKQVVFLMHLHMGLIEVVEA